MTKTIFVFFLLFIVNLSASTLSLSDVNILNIRDLSEDKLTASDRELLNFFKSYWSAQTYSQYTKHFLPGEAPAFTDEQYAILRENILKIKIEPLIAFQLSIVGKGYGAIAYTETDNATIQRKIFLIKEKDGKHYAVTESINRQTRDLRKFLAYFRPEGLKKFDTVVKLLGERIGILASLKDSTESREQLSRAVLNAPWTIINTSMDSAAIQLPQQDYAAYLYNEIIMEIVPDLNSVSEAMLGANTALLTRLDFIKLQQSQQKQLVAYIQAKNFVGAANYIVASSGGSVSKVDAVKMIQEIYGKESIFTFDSRR